MSEEATPQSEPSRDRLRGRWRALALFGALGAAWTIAHARATATTVDDLARALGESANGVVLPADVRWEPSRGALTDAAIGRFVVFLASDTKGGPRDVWRARVHVTPEGQVLEVASAHNLTMTPLGDDHAIVLEGHRAAFATLAYGQEQSVTLLDLAGEGSQNTTEKASDRAMSWLTNVQETGSGDGVARVDVTLDEPAHGIGLALTDEKLAIDLDVNGSIRHASLDVARGELAAPAPGLRTTPSRHLPKRFVFWAVDTVRAIPWIGPAPIAWLEEKVFALRDDAKQLAFKLHGADPTDTLAAPHDVAPPAPPSILDGSQASADTAHWPPRDIPSIWKTPEPGEGEWVAPKLPWMRSIPTVIAAGASPPPAFLRTFVRPDEERPYAKVILVAMDMRQLELDMEAGVEDPKPLTGAHGTGRLPREPNVYTRVVAAFNGAFKTEHGNYGMMVHKRVLLPPQPGAATVIVTSDNRVGLGTWGDNHDVTGVRGIADGDIVSFRQNLEALVDNGQLNPSGRALWGYTLPGTGMQTERSGMCVTDAGHMVYAWGDDVSATTLGKAMKWAGCAYGMHLDMNPHHTGFLFATIHDFKGHAYKSEVLTPLMEISPDRYIEYSPKDFFYVMAHDPTPAAIDRDPNATWSPDSGVQPAPSWMPGIWRAKMGSIELFDLEAGRATWRIRAGESEPDAKTGATPLRELSDDDAHRVLFALPFGVAHEKHPRGLVTDGKVVLPMIGDARGHASGVLVATNDAALAIRKADEIDPATMAHADAAEAPLILDEGAVIENVPPGSVATLHAAIGTTNDGRVIVARGDVGYGPLADALKRAGCTRAVALDRGAHASASYDRAGTDSPPRARYAETTLYAIATPLKPRGFRFEALTPVVPPATRPK